MVEGDGMIKYIEEKIDSLARIILLLLNLKPWFALLVFAIGCIA